MDEKANILVVDDDESIRKSLKLILEKKGYKAQTAGTGQEAVDKAAEGDTILVAPGTYTEHIYITKKLSLQATGGYKNTFIKGKLPDASVVTIEQVDGVVLTGFTVRGSRNAGIHLRRATGSRISENYVEYNLMGIYLEYASKNEITKNIATRNADGINLYFSFRNKLTANEAYKNSEKGIVLYSSNGNRLISNEIKPKKK